MQCVPKLLLQKKVLKNKINFNNKFKLINKPVYINSLKKNYQIYYTLSFFLNNYNYFSFFSQPLFDLFKNYNYFLILNQKSLKKDYSFFLLIFLYKINNFYYYLKTNKKIILKKQETFFNFFIKKYSITLKLSDTIHKFLEKFAVASYFQFRTSILDIKILFFNLLNTNNYDAFLFLDNKKKFSYKLLKNIFEDTINSIQKINNKQYFFYNIYRIYYSFNKKWKKFEKYNKLILINSCRNKLIQYFSIIYKNTFKIFYTHFYRNLILKRYYLF